MGILYRRGAYATRGGSQWYTTNDQLAKAGGGMLEYDVYFPSGFTFNKGGKLPGLFGGNYMCSGSKVSNPSTVKVYLCGLKQTLQFAPN